MSGGPRRFECSSCGREYPLETTAYRCECGGLFVLTPAVVRFDRSVLARRPATLWRYREAIPVAPASAAAVTMGEGMTPLVGVGGVTAKVDFTMPTLSFKDRGAAVLVAKAHELGVQRVVADSSGNAGTAIAAYAARAGMTCDVFVPAATSPRKLAQMRHHGAQVHAVDGTREDTAAEALAFVEATGAFYASHVYNPLFFEGTKTFGLEVWEQLGGRAPSTLVLPVGNGTLVLGCAVAFAELVAAGLVEEVPRIVAVQAEPCAPIAAAFSAGADLVTPVVNQGTAAEGIAIAAPARGDQVLAAVRASGGEVVAVAEEAIAPAREALAAHGFDVEPTAAAVYAAVLAAGGALGDDVVFPLCGAGLKSP